MLEFDRPPGIAALKLQMGIAIVLPLIWLGARERPWSWVLTAQVLLLAATASMIPFAHNNYAAYFTTRMLFSSIGIAITMAWLFAGRAAFRRFYWAWLLVIAWVGLFGITHGGHGPGASSVTRTTSHSRALVRFRSRSTASSSSRAGGASWPAAAACCSCSPSS